MMHMCRARVIYMRVMRVCSVCRLYVIFYRRFHTRVKSLIDTQVHAHAVFARAVTCTRSFYACDNIHTQFINTHVLLYASAYSLATYVYT